jgi:isoleucyl-tRNA synthetase
MDTLRSEWDFLLSLRAAALGDLELLRAQKELGKSLEAHVGITAPAHHFAIITKYEATLAELFNVSSVKVILDTDADLFMDVRKALQPKCDRCWRHVPDVGQYPAYPTVCLRCVEALDAINFPPYPAT